MVSVNEEFWRLVNLAEDNPQTYRLEMECRRWWDLARKASPVDYDYLEGALVNYFGLPKYQASHIMDLVSDQWRAKWCR